MLTSTFATTSTGQGKQPGKFTVFRHRRTSDSSNASSSHIHGNNNNNYLKHQGQSQGHGQGHPSDLSDANGYHRPNSKSYLHHRNDPRLIQGENYQNSHQYGSHLGNDLEYDPDNDHDNDNEEDDGRLSRSYRFTDDEKNPFEMGRSTRVQNFHDRMHREKMEKIQKMKRAGQVQGQSHGQTQGNRNRGLINHLDDVDTDVDRDHDFDLDPLPERDDRFCTSLSPIPGQSKRLGSGQGQNGHSSSKTMTTPPKSRHRSRNHSTSQIPGQGSNLLPSSLSLSHLGQGPTLGRHSIPNVIGSRPLFHKSPGILGLMGLENGNSNNHYKNGSSLYNTRKNSLVSSLSSSSLSSSSSSNNHPQNTPRQKQVTQVIAADVIRPQTQSLPKPERKTEVDPKDDLASQEKRIAKTLLNLHIQAAKNVASSQNLQNFQNFHPRPQLYEESSDLYDETGNLHGNLNPNSDPTSFGHSLPHPPRKISVSSTRSSASAPAFGQTGKNNKKPRSKFVLKSPLKKNSVGDLAVEEIGRDPDNNNIDPRSTDGYEISTNPNGIDLGSQVKGQEKRQDKYYYEQTQARTIEERNEHGRVDVENGKTNKEKFDSQLSGVNCNSNSSQIPMTHKEKDKEKSFFHSLTRRKEKDKDKSKSGQKCENYQQIASVKSVLPTSPSPTQSPTSKTTSKNSANPILLHYHHNELTEPENIRQDESASSSSSFVNSLKKSAKNKIGLGKNLERSKEDRKFELPANHDLSTSKSPHGDQLNRQQPKERGIEVDILPGREQLMSPSNSTFPPSKSRMMSKAGRLPKMGGMSMIGDMTSRGRSLSLPEKIWNEFLRNSTNSPDDLGPRENSLSREIEQLERRMEMKMKIHGENNPENPNPMRDLELLEKEMEEEEEEQKKLEQIQHQLEQSSRRLFGNCNHLNVNLNLSPILDESWNSTSSSSNFVKNGAKNEPVEKLETSKLKSKLKFQLLKQKSKATTRDQSNFDKSIAEIMNGEIGLRVRNEIENDNRRISQPTLISLPGPPIRNSEGKAANQSLSKKERKQQEKLQLNLDSTSNSKSNSKSSSNSNSTARGGRSRWKIFTDGFRRRSSSKSNSNSQAKSKSKTSPTSKSKNVGKSTSKPKSKAGASTSNSKSKRETKNSEDFKFSQSSMSFSNLHSPSSSNSDSNYFPSNSTATSNPNLIISNPRDHLVMAFNRNQNPGSSNAHRRHSDILHHHPNSMSFPNLKATSNLSNSYMTLDDPAMKKIRGQPFAIRSTTTTLTQTQTIPNPFSRSSSHLNSTNPNFRSKKSESSHEKWFVPNVVPLTQPAISSMSSSKILLEQQQKLNEESMMTSGHGHCHGMGQGQHQNGEQLFECKIGLDLDLDSDNDYEDFPYSRKNSVSNSTRSNSVTSLSDSPSNRSLSPNIVKRTPANFLKSFRLKRNKVSTFVADSLQNKDKDKKSSKMESPKAKKKQEKESKKNEKSISKASFSLKKGKNLSKSVDKKSKKVEKEKAKKKDKKTKKMTSKNSNSNLDENPSSKDGKSQKSRRKSANIFSAFYIASGHRESPATNDFEDITLHLASGELKNTKTGSIIGQVPMAVTTVTSKIRLGHNGQNSNSNSTPSSNSNSLTNSKSKASEQLLNSTSNSNSNSSPISSSSPGPTYISIKKSVETAEKMTMTTELDFPRQDDVENGNHSQHYSSSSHSTVSSRNAGEISSRLNLNRRSFSSLAAKLKSKRRDKDKEKNKDKSESNSIFYTNENETGAPGESGKGSPDKPETNVLDSRTKAQLEDNGLRKLLSHSHLYAQVAKVNKNPSAEDLSCSAVLLPPQQGMDRNSIGSQTEHFSMPPVHSPLPRSSPAQEQQQQLIHDGNTGLTPGLSPSPSSKGLFDRVRDSVLQRQSSVLSGGSSRKSSSVTHFNFSSDPNQNFNQNLNLNLNPSPSPNPQEQNVNVNPPLESPDLYIRPSSLISGEPNDQKKISEEKLQDVNSSVNYGKKHVNPYDCFQASSACPSPVEASSSVSVPVPAPRGGSRRGKNRESPLARSSVLGWNQHTTQNQPENPREREQEIENVRAGEILSSDSDFQNNLQIQSSRVGSSYGQQVARSSSSVQSTANKNLVQNSKSRLRSKLSIKRRGSGSSPRNSSDEEVTSPGRGQGQVSAPTTPTVPPPLSSVSSSSSLSSCSWSNSRSNKGQTQVPQVNSGTNSLTNLNPTDYDGPFQGRALALVDCISSPYDTHALRFKKGDIINIISKKPSGSWTGMVNGQIGHFKFINVQILPDEEPDLISKPDEEETQNLRPGLDLNLDSEEIQNRLGNPGIDGISMISIPYEGDYSRDEDYYYNTCTRTRDDLNVSLGENRISMNPISEGQSSQPSQSQLQMEKERNRERRIRRNRKMSSLTPIELEERTSLATAINGLRKENAALKRESKTSSSSKSGENSPFTSLGHQEDDNYYGIPGEYPLNDSPLPTRLPGSRGQSPRKNSFSSSQSSRPQPLPRWSQGQNSSQSQGSGPGQSQNQVSRSSSQLSGKKGDQKSRSKERKSRPKSVSDLLMRINLQEHIAVFILHGFDTLPMFKELEEEDLNRLNIHGAHRARIMTAVELLREYDTEEEIPEILMPTPIPVPIPTPEFNAGENILVKSKQSLPEENFSGSEENDNDKEVFEVEKEDISSHFPNADKTRNTLENSDKTGEEDENSSGNSGKAPLPEKIRSEWNPNPIRGILPQKIASVSTTGSTSGSSFRKSLGPTTGGSTSSFNYNYNYGPSFGSPTTSTSSSTPVLAPASGVKTREKLPEKVKLAEENGGESDKSSSSDLYVDVKQRFLNARSMFEMASNQDGGHSQYTKGQRRISSSGGGYGGEKSSDSGISCSPNSPPL